MSALMLKRSGVVESESRWLAKCDLDLEDCTYLLHALETEAFSAVVAAMRAQGIFTQYNEALLDHLKTALCISDATYKAEIRRVAEDDVLCRIAQTLNPSYDTFTQWGTTGSDPVPASFPEVRLCESSEIEGLEMADQLLRLANSHNATIEDNNATLCELIALPKAPFVPEKLRALLKETESSERAKLQVTDECSEHTASLPKKQQSSTSKKGRKARADKQPTLKQEVKALKTEGEVVERLGNDASETSEPTELALLRDYKPAGDGAHQKSFHDGEETKYDCLSGQYDGAGAVRGVTAGTASQCAQPATAPSVVCTSQRISPPVARCAVKLDKRRSLTDDVNDTVFSEDDKPKKRRMKTRETATCVCARVLPFIFEPIAPGQKAKPPRGNPDRRSSKRSSPTSAGSLGSTGALSTVCGVAGQSQQAYACSAGACSSRSVPLSPSTPAAITRLQHTSSQHCVASTGVHLKRSRTTSGNSDQAASNDGASYIRGVQGNQGPGKVQQQSRAYMRPTASAKYFVSSPQAAAAYSNPTRPYYGNPSAAAMGITVRSAGGGAASSGAAPPPGLPDKFASSPHNGQIGEIQLFTGHDYSSQGPLLAPALHQQYKAARSGSLSSKPGYSGTSPVGARAGPGPAAAVQHIASQSPLQDSVAAGYGVAAGSPASDQHAGIAKGVSFTVSHPVTQPSFTPTARSAAFTQATSHQSERLDNGKEESNTLLEKTAESDSTLDIPDEDGFSQRVRLECDEVMAPEQRCLTASLISRMDPSARLDHVVRPAPRDGQPISRLLDYGGDVDGGERGRRSAQQECLNGVGHQEEHEAVNFVATGPCIR